MIRNGMTLDIRQGALALGVAVLAIAIAAPAVSAASAKTKRASEKTGGIEANGGVSSMPSVSGNGRFVAFESSFVNLVNNDTNGLTDIFVYDRVKKRTRRVNLRSNGAEAKIGHSYSPSISANGRFVAFWSHATNLVKNDDNARPDVFVHDRKTKKTRRVSVKSNGNQGKDGSAFPSISANGRFVAFQSAARNLVRKDTNNMTDVFVHDRATKRTTRVNRRSNGAQAKNGPSDEASISDDGRYVAFRSGATNLVKKDDNSLTDAFVHDRRTGKTRRVNLRKNGSQVTAGAPSGIAISGNGRFIAFASESKDLVPGDSNDRADVFVRDRVKNKTRRVSKANDGSQADANSWEPSISTTGRYVSFRSYAENLVGADDNGLIDVFVRDRSKKKTKRVSVATGGTQAVGGGSWENAISGDGRFVAYRSDATNLIAADGNGLPDIFLRGPLH